MLLLEFMAVNISKDYLIAENIKALVIIIGLVKNLNKDINGIPENYRYTHNPKVGSSNHLPVTNQKPVIDGLYSCNRFEMITLFSRIRKD